MGHVPLSAGLAQVAAKFARRRNTSERSGHFEGSNNEIADSRIAGCDSAKSTSGPFRLWAVCWSNFHGHLDRWNPPARET